MLEHEDLTGRIIGGAIEVHRILGPGFLESIYERALCIELGKRGVAYNSQLLIPVFYDGVKIGQHRLDLLVENQIVVELKAVKTFDPIHFAQVKSYLKAARLHHGLLLNFASSKLEIKRVIHS